ncbi:MAG: radical SAM family heme chaperone HemW [Candidatus Dormibacteria bacterium]
MNPIRTLYLHIPFCERKCEYCDFTSVAGTRGEHEYMGALDREVRLLAQRGGAAELDSVFVGGGTPSLVDPELLAGVLATVGEHFHLAPGAEITLEANPSSTTRERAEVWRRAGFNRVSIGVQSLEPDILAFLGRVHDAPRALSAVAEVRDAGFDSVNCDLIYAVPGLDDARWRHTLTRVLESEPDHVSCYELTVEPGTPLHTSVRRGRVSPADAEVALAQHAIALDVLERAGYGQYEVSNFARPGGACRHNLAYWHNAYYLAAGVGAHGHVPAALAASLLEVDAEDAVAVRYRHGRGIAAYAAAVTRGELPVTEHELISSAEHEQERLMLGLRLRQGITLTDAAVRREASVLASSGLLTLAGDVARVTRAGEAVLNAVTLRLALALS